MSILIILLIGLLSFYLSASISSAYYLHSTKFFSNKEVLVLAFLFFLPNKVLNKLIKY